MTKSKRIEGPFTSEYGTFNPGDSVIAITVCTGRIHVDRVEYVGYVVRKGYNYKTKQFDDVKFAQIRRPSQRFEWYNKETGEAEKWKANGNQGTRYVPTTIVSTLQYNRLLPATTSTDELINVL